jgi:hypothetical protein
VWVYGDDQRAWVINRRTNLARRTPRPGASKLVAKDGLVWYGKIHFTPAEVIAAANEALNPKPPVDV